MVLPALQVRVPNPANALLQAEQIKGVRAQAQERQQALQQRNALLQATQGADLTTPAGQQQVVSALAGANPLAALQAQLQINQANAPPTPTTAVRNFQFAQGNPGFQDFIRNTRPGTSVTVGSPNISLTTGTATEVQKNALDAQAAMTRLDTIASGFRPEFLQLPTQLGVGVDAFRERVLEPFGVAGLSPDERSRLSEFATFQRDATNNLSLFVQSLSGAAVTPQEAERLGKSVPVLGDSPTQFQSKLNASIRDGRRALARFNFALRNGLDPLNSGVALDGVDALIDQTGQQLLDQLLASGVSRDQALPMVDEELKRLFGI